MTRLVRLKRIMTNQIERFELIAPGFAIRILATILARKKNSFSFYGEDLVVEGIIKRLQFENESDFKLSYIDIGAWRPIQGSNTYRLYKSGSLGTAVEPNPYFNKLWKSIRPRDKFLEIACSNSSSGELLVFHPSAASNTLSPSFATVITDSQNYEIAQTIATRCLNLEEIIRIHLAENQGYFLLDIDIEGLDEEVITTFSFPDGLRPLLILVEDFLSPGQLIQDSRISLHLTDLNYKIVGRTALTSVFLDLKANISPPAKLK